MLRHGARQRRAVQAQHEGARTPAWAAWAAAARGSPGSPRPAPAWRCARAPNCAPGPPRPRSSSAAGGRRPSAGAECASPCRPSWVALVVVVVVVVAVAARAAPPQRRPSRPMWRRSGQSGGACRAAAMPQCRPMNRRTAAAGLIVASSSPTVPSPAGAVQHRAHHPIPVSYCQAHEVRDARAGCSSAARCRRMHRARCRRTFAASACWPGPTCRRSCRPPA